MQDTRRDQVEAARTAAREEAAREEDARKLNDARIQAELAKFRAEQEREMADTEVELLDEEAARALEEQWGSDSDDRDQEEERFENEEEEDRLAEEYLRSMHQAIVNRTDATDKQKRAESEARHRAVVADIIQRSKEAKKRLSAADQKVEEKARALRLATEREQESAALLEKASRERDNIDAERIETEEAEIRQWDAIRRLCLNTARVVATATFFVEMPETYEKAGRRLYFLLDECKKGGRSKISDEFVALLEKLVNQFGDFLGLIEEEEAKAYNKNVPRSVLADGMHRLKVDIIRLLVQFFRIDTFRAHLPDALLAMVSKPISHRVYRMQYREKRPTDEDVTILNSYASALRVFANKYVLVAENILRAKTDSVVQQRLLLKGRQEARATGFEHVRLTAVARRFLTPPHAKDRPNYVPVSVMVVARPKGKANRVMLDAYKTMADKVIGMFDHKQSRERNYGYVIHLGRQAAVRVIHIKGAYTGPIEEASYALLVFIDRAVAGALFTVPSGILRLPDNDEASLFRHAEARLAMTNEKDVRDYGKGVYEVFLKLSGKPTGDGRLPIKSMLFHRWSIALLDEENIHKISEAEIALNDVDEPDEVESWDDVEFDDAESDDDDA